MSKEKSEQARREIIGIIIDLLIHDFDKSSIMDVLAFNENDITEIDKTYGMTEKICINIARDLYLFNISIGDLEKATGVDRAVFKEFVKEI